MEAQGWYLDPYRRHEQRWFSDGTPTALVRDQGKDGRDEPPDSAPERPLVRPGNVDVPPSGADDRENAGDQLFGTVYGNLYAFPRDE